MDNESQGTQKDVEESIENDDDKNPGDESDGTQRNVKDSIVNDIEFNPGDEINGTQRNDKDSTDNNKEIVPDGYVCKKTVNYRMKKWLEEQNLIKAKDK